MLRSSFESVLEHIYTAATDPSAWINVLTRVADYLNADGGMLIHIPAVGEGKPIATYARLSLEHAELVRERYPWNPWSRAMIGVPSNRAVVANALIGSKAVFKTPFYADVLRPQGHVDILNVQHLALSKGGGVGGFGFCLTQKGADLAHENVRHLQRLTPHLSRALDTSLLLGGLESSAHHLTRILQIMPTPALLLDSKCRISLANQPAETLLRANDGLSCDRDGGLRLTAALPSETAALTRALADALSVASGTGEFLGDPLKLTRPSGQPPLLIMPVPLPPPSFALWNLNEPARVLLIVVDPTAHWHGKAATIQQTFGLTEAEARVAALVASGLNGPQSAKVLGVSTSTVKTHLKRCFEKTGIHSQIGISRLFSGVPTNTTNFRLPSR